MSKTSNLKPLIKTSQLTKAIQMNETTHIAEIAQNTKA